MSGSVWIAVAVGLLLAARIIRPLERPLVWAAFAGTAFALAAGLTLGWSARPLLGGALVAAFFGLLVLAPAQDPAK